MTKPTSVAEYLDQVPDAARSHLDKVRATISGALPGAEEVISYSIIGYRLEGKVVAYCSGWANHVAVYPVPTGDDEFCEAIAPHLAGKGTAKYTLTEPLPLGLIAQQVRLLAQARGVLSQP
jgi:uncharacterized protein YdhG (YjbR/CyaY superfamily)